MPDRHEGDTKFHRCPDTSELESAIGRVGLTDLRLALARNGYRPVPVAAPWLKSCRSPGKQPLMPKWQEVCAGADEKEIRRWADSEVNCTNTGLLCGDLIGVDVDVLNPELAEKIRAMGVAMLGATPLVRIGRAPKVLFCYRAADPFRKMETPELFFPGGTKAQVEILAAGQQFVAHGVHPDTMKPYRWPNSAPETVRLDELPAVGSDHLAAFLEAVEKIIRAAGGRTQVEIDGKAGKAPPSGAKRIDFGKASDSDDFFKRVNRAALDAIETWFPAVFSSAKPQSGTGAWRVSSADLGRPLEEDISVHPVEGGRDFGTGKSISPIDVVMEHGGASDVKQAALWLCERIGVDPAALGWKKKDGGAADRGAGAPLPDGSWYERVITGSRDQPLSILANAMMALREDPTWKGVLAYDEMQATALLCKPVPRFGKSPASGVYPRPVRDDDVIQVQEWFQIAGLPTLGRETTHDAVDLRARECGFHPVRDYLSRLKWDGVKRLETWLNVYLGAEDTPYSRAIGRMFMVSAVARILKPGCKVDYMLILEGRQGIRKSTVCRILGGDWFADSLPENIASKDAAQHLRGKWVIEFGEMHALSKSETTALKAFITRQVENYRPSYGRKEVHEPRQCVFIGTTNKAQYLKDETGARRFWPVKVAVARPMNTDLLIKQRDQLFAEAVHRFRAGEPWWPNQEFESRYIQPEQEARFEADIWEDPIRNYLEGKEKVLVVDVARIGVGKETEKVGTADQRRITSILERLGWKSGTKDWKGNRWWVPCR